MSQPKSNVVSVNNQLIGALGKYVPKTITIGGEPWATKDVIAKLAAENAAIAATASAKNTLAAAVTTMTADRAPNVALRAGLRLAVLVQFGNEPDVLDGFGYAKPSKRPPATPEAKLIAAAKLRATREARGTLGSKQRKAFNKALVTPYTVTVAPASPASPAAPAAVPAPSGTTK